MNMISVNEESNKAKIELLTVERETLRKDNTALTENNTKLAAEKQKLAEETKSTQEEKAKLSNEMETLKKAKEQQTIELQTLEQQRLADKRTAEDDVKVNELKNDNMKLSEQLEAVRANENELQVQCNDLKSRVSYYEDASERQKKAMGTHKSPAEALEYAVSRADSMSCCGDGDGDGAALEDTVAMLKKQLNEWQRGFEDEARGKSYTS